MDWPTRENEESGGFHTVSVIKKEDERKWINAFSALVGIISGHLAIQILRQLSAWFDLEARIDHFAYVSQGVGVLTGLAVFITILKHQKSSKHLTEVYGELLKVIWPDKDTVVKVTIGIVVAVSIISGIFVGVDFIFQKTLELVY